jgi:hypothetical protein
MPPQIEEVVVNADGTYTQQLLPEGDELVFQRVSRGRNRPIFLRLHYLDLE